MTRPPGETVEDRFWAKVRITPGCWEWTGSRNEKGYGIFLFLPGIRRTRRAHGFSYEMVNGPIPEGLVLDHLCHNSDPDCPGGPRCPHRACVNPDHLEPVTRGENTSRGYRASGGRGSHNGAKTHCPHGHEYTPENTQRDEKGHRHCLKCVAARRVRKRVRTPAH